MGKFKIKYCFLMLLFSLSVVAQPRRETKAGALLSYEMEQSLYRNFSISFEDELRFVSNAIGFDRNVASLGIDCSLLDKKLKIGASYAFIYLYNDDQMFEPRHRFYANVTYKQAFGRQWTVSWRGRVQATVRNENHDSYRVNPRFVMKNKLEIEYAIWGKPLKPYLSCDFSNNLNDHITRYDFVRLRFQGGVGWRITRTDYLNFFLRFDENFKEDDPRVISLGAGYRMKR